MSRSETTGINAYTFRIAWSEDDGEWVATCDQLPSLSYLHPGASDAVEGIFATVVDYVKDQTP